MSAENRLAVRLLLNLFTLKCRERHGGLKYDEFCHQIIEGRRWVAGRRAHRLISVNQVTSEAFHVLALVLRSLRL